jgi:hypothetical protein
MVSCLGDIISNEGDAAEVFYLEVGEAQYLGFGKSEASYRTIRAGKTSDGVKVKKMICLRHERCCIGRQ